MFLYILKIFRFTNFLLYLPFPPRSFARSCDLRISSTSNFHLGLASGRGPCNPQYRLDNDICFCSIGCECKAESHSSHGTNWQSVGAQSSTATRVRVYQATGAYPTHAGEENE